MEEFIISIIQASPEVLEIILKIIKGDLFKLLFWGYNSLANWPNLSESAQVAWACFFKLTFGLVIGVCSIHFFPNMFFRWSTERVLLFFLGPLFTGMISGGAAYLQTINLKVSLYCFLFITLFVFGINIPRFGYCHRFHIANEHSALSIPR